MWAGYLEVQAASMVLQRNIYIHQAGQPRWAVKNFPESPLDMHLSYHDGQHYNSVRLAGKHAQLLKGKGVCLLSVRPLHQQLMAPIMRSLVKRYDDSIVSKVLGIASGAD